MKKLVTATLFAMMSLTIMAAEVIPNYPEVARDNIVLASKVEFAQGIQLNISTKKLPFGDVYYAYVVKDNQIIAKQKMNYERGDQFAAQIILAKDIKGYLEVFFSNDKGNYISDYGRNFHFILN